MAAIANLFIDQGATFSTTVTVTNADGSAFDLTSHTVAAQIRKSYSSSSKTDFTASIADPATAGQIQLQLTASIK